MEMQEMTVQELKELLDSGDDFVLLDVRMSMTLLGFQVQC